MCKKEFEIPPDGLVGLQHHFFIQHLVDTRSVSSKSTDGVACEVCLEENEGSQRIVQQRLFIALTANRSCVSVVVDCIDDG